MSRIFLLAPGYLDLYVPIAEELERSGHQVYYCKDVVLPGDTYWKNFHIRFRRLKRLWQRLTSYYENYWKEKIRLEPQHYDCPYDYLFCINGTSFHPFLLNHLRSRNSAIKTCLYLWDTNKYYDYLRNRRCFDKVFTFDMADAGRNDGVEYLPFYWVPSQPQVGGCKYVLSIVGSNHDNRINIVSKLGEQLKAWGLPFYMKLYVWTRELSAAEQRDYDNAVRNNDAEKIEHYRVKTGQDYGEYTTTERLSVAECNRILLESACVLDTDRPSQTGLTPRIIWALALGKKVVSTNTNLRSMPFYDERQIMIIDRDTPVLDKAFITDTTTFPVHPFFENLKIDKWVKNFIS